MPTNVLPPDSLDDLASWLRRADRKLRADRLKRAAYGRGRENTFWRKALAHAELRAIPTSDARVVAHELVQDSEEAAIAAFDDWEVAAMTGPDPACSYTVAHEATHWHPEAARRALERPAIWELQDGRWTVAVWAMFHHPETTRTLFESPDLDPRLVVELLPHAPQGFAQPFRRTFTDGMAQGRFPVADWPPEALAALLASEDRRLRQEVLLAMGRRAQKGDRKGETPAPNPPPSAGP